MRSETVREKVTVGMPRPGAVHMDGARGVTPCTEVDKPEAKQHWKEAEHDIGSPAGGAISTAEETW